MKQIDRDYELIDTERDVRIIKAGNRTETGAAVVMSAIERGPNGKYLLLAISDESGITTMSIPIK